MPHLIQAQNLCLGYDELVIEKANFAFNDKDFVFITGKSGSGKSTLLKSFYGDLEPLAGKLEVCESSLKGIGNFELLKLRQKIGIIFQDYKLIQEYSIEKNIMLPLMIKGYSKKACQEQAAKLLKHVNLIFKANKKPDQLSGGEQQRVAMARALAHNPKLLLCDEPTGNLDEYSSDIIWTLLKSANEVLKACVVVVTHRIPSHLKVNYRRFNIENGKMNEVF
ncbi:ABC transporter ATP-binding protein [Campylobacter sp. MIT 99-7217]|uniref:cell division ATP-binding protein FtsE n=1 Tax=Campylobacter sp. MIT 99-7217 TaxID=535091 RepID=UPI001159E760|nr:ABC transporter ATP-binding protein [Campylobacter sp. MIT 99-7217]TQR33772.1 ABC transporter ATP-binding protein [Campylobacter sp. MIT 99-7217]